MQYIVCSSIEYNMWYIAHTVLYIVVYCSTSVLPSISSDKKSRRQGVQLDMAGVLAVLDGLHWHWQLFWQVLRRSSGHLESLGRHLEDTWRGMGTLGGPWRALGRPGGGTWATLGGPWRALRGHLEVTCCALGGHSERLGGHLVILGGRLKPNAEAPDGQEDGPSDALRGKWSQNARVSTILKATGGA